LAWAWQGQERGYERPSSTNLLPIRLTQRIAGTSKGCDPLLEIAGRKAHPPHTPLLTATFCLKTGTVEASVDDNKQDAPVGAGAAATTPSLNINTITPTASKGNH